MAAQMSFADFEQSLTQEKGPSSGLSVALQALWFDGKGDWTTAHTLAQAAEEREGGVRDGAWVHAYLHRKEGDESNAAYWYVRAGRPVAKGDLATEWREIAKELLKSNLADKGLGEGNKSS